ncbi:MAG: UvrD-helicase domain-containing protein [Paludibacteraceae bacterium]
MLNIYRASAGSGKTFQLTKDYIFLLFDALENNSLRPHRRILAVTFTNKATDEMKSRILKELYSLSRGEKSNYRSDLMEKFTLSEKEVNEQAGKILIHILHDYSSFSISTIDKFFQQVVRSFAREIGISGGYNLELDNEVTLQQAVDNLYMNLSEKGNEQLLAWMTDFSEEQIVDGKSWNIEREITKLGKEIFKEDYQHKVEETREKLHNREFLNTYREKLNNIISGFKGKIYNAAEDTLAFLKSHNLEPDYFNRKMMYSTLENFKKGKYELGSIFLSFMESSANCYTRKQESAIKNAIDHAYNNGLKEKLDRIIHILNEDIINYNSALIIKKHLNTLGILSDLAYEVKKLTNEQNVMLLSDTNLLLNKIIDNSDTPFVYERTGVNIDHYMIDEFQDTSVLQWKNFKPLISNSLSGGLQDKSNQNMVVGDVKQSIYRWRNSDWKLLDEQVNHDFSPRQVNEQTLDTNWRSDKNVIQFNNLFFKSASALLQEKLSENIRAAITENPSLESLNTKIVHAYSDIEQHVSNKAATGHVQIQFIEKEGTKTDWETSVLERIPALLEDLVDRGYQPADIAFLVRSNKDATQLINFLLTYKNAPEARSGFSYEIVGNEGLTMTSSPSVNFIIAVLSLIFNPQDDINRTIMQYSYQLGKLKSSEDQAVRSCFAKVEEKSAAQSAFFTPEENKCIEEISRLSLFEAVEKLISTFRLEEWYNETVFLQAFQDIVFKFVNSRNADLSSFLRWWADNGEKQFISAPENQYAFRVMTVHKSKGLDFKVVIVPFCNWELDAARNKPLIWCETPVEPFNELPLMPVEYSKGLADSIFRNEYFNELMHQYVDNLNLAYVAFTRARNEMICFAEKPSKIPFEKINTVSDLLYCCLSDTTNAGLSPHWNAEIAAFELGEPTTAVYKEKREESITQKLTSYPVIDSSDRLKIRHTSADYWKTLPIAESRVNYGIIMHDILRKTVSRGDEEKAVNEQLISGKISDDDLKIIRKELKHFWSLPEVDAWFVSEAEVLNEATILLPTGEHYRPDRIILKDNEVTIVDYKFGEEEHQYHLRQLQQYVSLLLQMGYDKINSYLYYVSLGKIVKG